MKAMNSSVISSVGVKVMNSSGVSSISESSSGIKATMLSSQGFIGFGEWQRNRGVLLELVDGCEVQATLNWHQDFIFIFFTLESVDQLFRNPFSRFLTLSQSKTKIKDCDGQTHQLLTSEFLVPIVKSNLGLKGVFPLQVFTVAVTF